MEALSEFHTLLLKDSSMRLLSQDFKYDNTLKSCKEYTPEFPEGFHVGIEVEVENYRVRHQQADASKLWSTHQDGSLRNNGVEFVSLPVDGVNILKAVNALWDNMPDYSFSQRTSVHVHVNIRKLSYEQLAGLLAIYCVVEPLLFDFVGRGRQRNIFCIPVTETGYPDKWLMDISKGKGSVFGQWEKYSAVNLSRFAELGTIEFRQMHGTRDKEKILTWLEILSCLYQYAVAHPFEEVINKLTAANHYSEVTDEIFSPKVKGIFVKKDFNRLVKQGFERVLSAIEGANYATELISKINVTTSPFALYLKGLK